MTAASSTSGDAVADHCCVVVEAILFDLDGVLVDSTASVERVWRRFAGRHGLDADELLHDLHGRRMVDILAAALPHLDEAGLAGEAARLDAAEVADAGHTRPQPGARELTRGLAARGVAWAVATSGTSDVAAARIAAAGLQSPDVLVTADHVSTGKPDPEPYLAAAARLGVDAQRCLVVEDAPSGLRAGNAAGATTVAVTTSHATSELGDAAHLIGAVRDIEVEPGPERDLTIRLLCRRHGH